jgi:RNA polymerase sigma-70 factor, ECF subfamily
MDGCLTLAGDIPSSREEPGEETALIRLAQQGDHTAFDRLVRQYDQQVLRLILKIVPSADQAPDLYQEAFLKVYRSLGRFRFESRFSTWLYRVVTNACLDYLRRQKSREEIQAPEAREGETEFLQTVPEKRPGGNPERAAWSGEVRRRIEKALTRLAPRERMVFELRHFQGMKLKVIGEICGTTEETAKNSLFRATQKLRLELNDLV